MAVPMAAVAFNVILGYHFFFLEPFFARHSGGFKVGHGFDDLRILDFVNIYFFDVL